MQRDAAGAFGRWLLFCNVVVLLTALANRQSPRGYDALTDVVSPYDLPPP